jgi:hypothetical protein
VLILLFRLLNFTVEGTICHDFAVSFGFKILTSGCAGVMLISTQKATGQIIVAQTISVWGPRQEAGLGTLLAEDSASASP